MYIPKPFQNNNESDAINFAKQYPFGILITVNDGQQVATHLPFLIEDSNNTLSLTTHMAKANNQWKGVEENEVLIIFSHPHGYISPQNYTSKDNVPTWNYAALHMYCKAKLVSDPKELVSILHTTIGVFEPSFLKNLPEVSPRYIHALYEELVGVKLEVTRFEFAEKLSQNKSTQERMNIINSLNKSEFTASNELAKYMKSRESGI